MLRETCERQRKQTTRSDYWLRNLTDSVYGFQKGELDLAEAQKNFLRGAATMDIYD